MSSANPQSIFIEEDYSDSVASDTTLESEPEAEYSVEKILSEDNSDPDNPLYLVEWAGYGLHRCTWEPTTSFVDPASLSDWERQKRRIAAGRAEPFDVSKFNAALDHFEEQRARRHAKRAEKRRKKTNRRLVSRKILKKGTARSSNTPLSPAKQPSRKRVDPLFVESPSPTESGAKKRKRAVPEFRSPSPALSVNDIENSQHSLFNDTAASPGETLRKPSSTRPTTVSKRARVENNDAQPTARAKETNKQRIGISTGAASSSTPKDREKPRLSKAPNSVAQLETQNKATGSVVKDPPIKLTKSSTAPNLAQLPVTNISRRTSDAACTSAPTKPNYARTNADAPTSSITSNKHTAVAEDKSTSGPPASAASNIATKVAAKVPEPSRRAPIKLFHDPVKPRQRARVNEFTPKDSAGNQFVNLSIKGRMQSYSHNEPPPDTNALKFIDPSTGKTLDIDTNVTASTMPSVPAPEISSTIPTEPESGLPRGRVSPPLSARVDTEPKHAYPSALPAVPRPLRQAITCRFWLRGTCKFSESECKYSHRKTGQIESKKPITCQYWQKGHCRFSDEECEYLHEDINESIQENGFQSIQQPRRRSESPDLSGLRQDEAEQRSRSSFSHFQPRSDGRSLMPLPSAASTSSFDHKTGPLGRDVQTVYPRTDSPPVNTVHSPDISMPDIANQPDHVDPINASLSISPASPPLFTIDVKLAFDTQGNRTAFLGAVAIGESLSFECRDMCRSRDFESYLYSNDKALARASGGVICSPGDALAAYLEDYLIMHRAASVFRAEEYVLAIYPTLTSDWKFMPNRGPEKPGLRWYLQAARPELLEPIITRPTKSSFRSMCAEHLDLHPEVLFTGNQGKHMEKAVYLFFPREAPETELIEALMADTSAKVYHSDTYSLWDNFCNKGESANRVILFHPSMTKFWKIPEFSSVLAKSSNIFQVGVSKSIAGCPDAPTKFSCTQLFPRGELTLLTDDIFLHFPAMALKVLEFYQGQKTKPEGGRYDRVFCRPGILGWLAELIDEDREKGVLTQDSPRIKCWQLVCQLLDVTATDNTRNPLRSDMAPPSVLYSPPKSQMPDYTAMWDRSEEDASAYLVGWFAGHCIDRREDYRRFAVLYEQHGSVAAQTPGLLRSGDAKDPKGWMKKYTHVKVTTPNRFLTHRREYEKLKSSH